MAERLEELVRENIQLRERSESLQKQVDSQSHREQAVQEALVTAQELRSDIQSQAHRGAEVVLAETGGRGADVVEFNPRQDPAGMTARVGAKLVKELIAKADGVRS